MTARHRFRGFSARRRAALSALAAAGALALLASADGGNAAPRPAPASSAVSPGALAAQISANDGALREAIDAWRAAAGEPPAGQAPEEVIERAELLQRTVRSLAKRSNLADATIRLLPPALAGQVRTLTAAARKLRRLAGGGRPKRLRTGKPEPLANLVSYYDAAQRRHGAAQHYLAAINLVETRFGRVKSDSVAGARGPMQFIPSTWRIYGGGGNIRDPHDAILAAAHLLRDNGAPRSYSRALYAYNPSRLYVGAVGLYAKLIERDPYAVHFLYAWGP